jgi:DNA-binding transcriptional ArsR family regulator
MEMNGAVLALGALAQDRRLEIFRLLVRKGPEGIPASEIAMRLAIPAATLTFHLKELAHAGLVRSRRAGRFLFYSADFSAMNSLLQYLTENCCEGAGCETVAPPKNARRLPTRQGGTS